MSTMIVELDGKSYTWDSKSWYSTKDYIKPPELIVHRLNAIISPHLEEEEALISDPDELLSRAKEALAANQIKRAETLARRAYEIIPGNPGAAAVLSKILRVKGHPEESLAIGDKHIRSNYPPILTSRAAALCDLGRWKDALRQIRQVLAIVSHSKKHSSEEAFAVYARIKASAPNLF